MKIKLLIIVFFLFNCGLHAQSFIKTQGGATDVAISPKDGSVYVVGTSKNVFKYNFGTKRFGPVGAQTKDVSRIAVSKSNQIFAQKINGSVERSIGSSSWQKMSMFSTDVATDNTGYVWVAKRSGGDIQRYRSNWERPLSKVIINVDKIAPINNRVAWVLMKDKSIQKFENGAWKKMPGAALDISVDITTNNVYVVGTSRRIFKWNKSSKKWIPLNGTRTDFSSLDVHNGKIWATTTGKGIYYYGVAGQSSNSNSNSNSTTNYAGTYRVTFTKLLGVSASEHYGTMGVYVEAKTNSGNITIKPKNGASNRAWDISKGNPVKLRKKPVTVRNDQYINKNFNNGIGTDTWPYSLSIGTIKEFKIAGEAANDDIVFDFQFNVKGWNGPLEKGKWQRQKIRVTDLKLNYEYLYYDGVIGAICFKIEKQ